MREREKAQKLFEENMNLAPAILRKVIGKQAMNEDAIQSAYMALWRACLNFDESKSAKFSSYAARCIINQYTRDRKEREKSVEPSCYFGQLAYTANRADGSETTLEETVEDVSGASMESQIAFKDFVDRLEPDDRKVAIALICGKPLKRIFEENGVTWWWGTRRKRSIEMKLKAVMI